MKTTHMTALRSYLKGVNLLRDMFKRDRIRFPKTPEMCKPIFGELAGELSPENLCCDGELPPHQVRAKAKRLWAAWANLEEIYGRKVDEGEAWDWSEPTIGFGA